VTVAVPLPLPDAGRRIFTVSALTRAVKDTLEGTFGGLWVEGEVSNLRVHTSGHVYFTLKDEEAQIRAVLFRSRVRRLRFEPADGLHVLAFGRLDVYAVRGEYQLVCEILEPKGLGALQLAFEQLKARLAAEGLFDAARKRPLPALPRRVGLVTSPTGAAVRDFLRIVTRRFAGLQVLVCPVRVQGDTASGEIVEALSLLNRMGGLDVIVLARGGGSLEDLWAFNEEPVARAIAASKIPVISAVGHETDVTIADFVADLRAPTPSAAAELVVREKTELVRHLTTLRTRLRQAMGRRTGRHADRLADFRRRRVLTDPGRPLRDWARRLDDLGTRLGRAMRRHDARAHERLGRVTRALRPGLLAAPVRHHQALVRHLGGRLARVVRGETARRRRAVESLAARLDGLSPLACLARGYAIAAFGSGEVLTRADQVETGERITVRLREGSLGCRVEDVHAPEPGDHLAHGESDVRPA
jgi:exodeoxyribonuclease VII large subunit